LGRAVLLFYLLIGSINSDPLEKSYQNGLLTFSEWDLNRDCIVEYEEFKSWVLDMLMTVIKYQALVKAETPGRTDLEESTYDNVMKRVIGNMTRLSNQNANITQIMDRFLTRLERKLGSKKNAQYISSETLTRIFKFNSRLNLTFWYNL
ncbi:hypothetical protein PENTCL1PPCAC_28276, partial [Pristionchus entomophagus]